MSDNIIQLITQLNRHTLNGTISWLRDDAPYNITHGSDSYIPLFFSVLFNGAKFGIYEEKYKYFTDIDEYYWLSQVVLCILDESNLEVWKYNANISVLKDLFDNIRYKQSGIEDIFKRLPNN
ncbi:hypothetical protein [Serratia fonticola]|uniref:hypothetical protein n=1 Tax=Serratia fonticola TaxID=47917 RepID=UPI000BA2B392|nr:hypothetical protein [Serratia fonticola]PAA96797.1 hypothetical protein CJJ13_15905 [Serratia fonticola]